MFTLLYERHLAERLPESTPQEVREKIAESLKILDENYGDNREIDDNGGYVVYVPHDEPCSPAKLRELELDIGDTLPEFMETIETANGDFIKALYMFSSDYGLVLFIPKKYAPEWLLEEVNNE